MKNTIKDLEQKVKQLKFLNNLSKSLGATLDPHRVVDIVASELSSIVQYDVFSLLFFSMAGDSTQPPHTSEANMLLKIKSDFTIKNNFFSRLKNTTLKTFYDMPGDDIFIGTINNGGRKAKGNPGSSVLPRISSLKTQISIPLCDRREKKVGVINLASFDKQCLSDQTREVLFGAADQTLLALKNATIHKKITELANRDGLTNVYNRMAFEEMLTNEYNRALRYQKPISLLMIDLDNLKVINDTQGHQAGDTVLKDIAHIMLSCVRKTDMVARYGGDEFAIILPNTDIKKTDKLTKRIHDNIKEWYAVLDKDSRPTVSIGVTSLVASSVSSCKGFIKVADSALYLAKRQGKGRSVRQ